MCTVYSVDHVEGASAVGGDCLSWRWYVLDIGVQILKFLVVVVVVVVVGERYGVEMKKGSVGDLFDTDRRGEMCS